MKGSTYFIIDFLRSPRPQGERRKSIYFPWGRGKSIDFQALGPVKVHNKIIDEISYIY
jgi:hypothetical protein